ncbi:hypothetical protein K438DRAFT_1759122 [Mycena galopus ATCC 62051]|nr:hypothetical protein K438DRAFT_1759122 [Mycena galopus ATCC 62051]
MPSSRRDTMQRFHNKVAECRQLHVLRHLLHQTWCLPSSGYPHPEPIVVPDDKKADIAHIRLAVTVVLTRPYLQLPKYAALFLEPQGIMSHRDAGFTKCLRNVSLCASSPASAQSNDFCDYFARTKWMQAMGARGRRKVLQGAPRPRKAHKPWTPLKDLESFKRWL